MNSKSMGIIALLTAGMFINAIDRGALGVAAPMIIKELKLDPAMMGVALSAFYWSYMLCMFPVGRLADKFGAKKVLGWAAALWSIMSAATGLVQGMNGLVLTRLGVGAGEAAGNPVSAKVVNENFSSEQRATATGFYLSGTKLGMAAVPILMGFLMTQWNWRVAFIVTGLASLLWCVVWYFAFKSPADTEVVRKKISIPWKKFLTHRCIVGLMITKFFMDYLWVLFVTWVPSYLVMERGFSIIKMGIYASIPWVVGFLAQPAIGMFSDWLIKRGWSVTQARKYTLAGSLLIASSVLAVGYIDDPIWAVVLLTINIAGESAGAGIMWTILAEVAPPRMGGTVPSAINTVSSIAGICAPMITGFIYKFTGSFQMALLVGGVGLAVAAFTILYVVPEIKPIELDEA